MSNPTAVSDIERQEHDASLGVKKTLNYGSDGSNARTLKTDTDGHLQVDVLTDPTSPYKITDLATGYYGYTKDDGGWYIMQLTDTTARYVKGDSDYATAWGDKENLNYNYYFNIF